jgi:adenylate cyclase
MARSFLPLSIKKRVPAIIALVITALFGYLATVRASFTDDSFLTSLEMRWIDAKFRFRGVRLPGPEVIIVGIDEKSLNDPEWGSASSLHHDKMATVIRNLAKAKPKVIGFDMLFGDPDGENPENPGQRSKRDQELADAIKEAGNVVLGVYLDLKTDPQARQRLESTIITPEMDLLSGQKFAYLSPRCSNGPCEPHEFFQGRTLKLSLPEFIAGSKAFGYVNFHPDREGRLRHQPQVINYMGQYYMSLDLQLVREYLGEGSPLLEQNGNLIEAITLGSGDEVPVDEFGRYMLNFSGRGGLRPDGARRIVSIIDVLKDDQERAPPELFEGKIVLVGAEAIGLGDIRPTPFDSIYPGVELHADIIDTILHKNHLTRNGMQLFDVLVIVVFGILLGISLPRMNASRAIFYTGLLLALFTIANVLSFTIANIVLGYIYPGIALVFISGSLISYQYLTEEREKKRTRQTFQYYLDPHMIEQVMTQPDALKLGGEKREMSVLFSDIRGFTSFSEKMAPTEVVNFLNQYFDKMTGLIFQYKGTLDKLIGDAVMCFWGHPLDIKDHAVKATLCALEMIQAVEDLRPVLILPGGARFDIGIGVNTGQMVVGNMGAQSRFSYTVMGDNVNLGSRLESLNKYYGTKILISDTTYEECKDVIFCRELDKIQVKGKSQAVTIYEPLGVRHRGEERRTRPERRGKLTFGKRLKKAYILARHGERRQQDRRAVSDRLLLTARQEEIATIYEHALALYRTADFDAAEKAFDHVLSLNPSDGPSRLMKGRIEKYRTEYIGTESTFDPVYKFDEK